MQVIMPMLKRGLACHVKSGPPIFSSPGPNISKYLDPQIVYFNLIEIFGLPEQ